MIRENITDWKDIGKLFNIMEHPRVPDRSLLNKGYVNRYEIQKIQYDELTRMRNKDILDLKMKLDLELPIIRREMEENEPERRDRDLLGDIFEDMDKYDQLKREVGVGQSPIREEKKQRSPKDRKADISTRLQNELEMDLESSEDEAEKKPKSKIRIIKTQKKEKKENKKSSTTSKGKKLVAL